MNMTVLRSESPGKVTWNHKIIWISFVVPLFITLAVIGSLNFIVDPFGIYGTGLFPPVTFSKYEHKLRLLREFQPKPQALIIGSSRVESVDPELVEELTGKRCFNWANPLAKTELFYAELRIALDEINAPLDMVIVGVEPTVFHPTAGTPPQALSLISYMRYVTDKAAVSVFMEKSSRLFSFEQTDSTFKVLLGTSGYDPNEEHRWEPNGFLRLNDYGILTKDIIIEGIENEMRRFPKADFGDDDYSNLNPIRMMYWEEFLKICDQREIRVYAYMTPLHHDLLESVYQLEEFNADALYSETTEYLSRTIGEIGGVFRNYTDVNSFNGDPEGFMDVIHLSPSNGDILIRHLLADDYPTEIQE